MGRGLGKLKGIKPVMAVLALCAMVQSAAVILQAVWLAQAISGLFAGDSLSEQAGRLTGFLAALLLRQGMTFVQSKVSYRFAEKTGEELRRQMMDKLFELGPRAAGKLGTGNLVTLVREGVGKYRTFLELFLPRLMTNVFTPLFIGLYVLRLDWISALLLGFVFPILIAFMILLGMAAQKQMDKQWATYRVLSNHFVDSLRGLETLKFLGRSRAHAESIERTSERYRKATIRSMRVAFLSSFALDFFTMLSVACVAVSLGLRLVNGTFMLEGALTILILAPEFFVPIRSLGADYHATMDGKEAGEQIQAIIDAPSPFNESDQQGNERESSIGQEYGERLAGVEASSVFPALRLRGVTVRHDEDAPASLQDVNLELTGPRKIGVVGLSGAGKSTLIDVLGGFLPPGAGSACWTDGGEERPLTGRAWKEQMTYIPQQPYLFSGTLAENIAFYRPDASPAEVRRAAEDAGLAGVLNKLPLGLDEPVGAGGRPLSGGQEQRAALARALLGGRRIMLLDEPTAHLDIETEYELKATMLKLFENRLVILATHRLHWMADMDHIIVMDGGRAVEEGTHEELLARGGAYAAMLAAEWEGTA
ncbi:thiol reductant ABC exporter subunit CydD [Saccharibacillus alkalitolerans]|uniref:Thiol reductant ABC exporter subunit CydD n=1 Tax=Saccharibacillus alkalitolerans TaxID=2705290 RepID=A0ABX0F6Z2_9BACL|nr:thiol reductant ABC exporter subunit CydD [Saccharibacillus alkalitolerans]NGZ76732.1 thiol reductant ABC exporter subunit CydD [Saccharibacillus alkalitolerans]